VGEIRRALCHARHLDAAFVVDEYQQLHVPRKHSRHRVAPERTLARQAQRQAGQFHANTRLLARRFELGARAGDVAGEGAQRIGIKAAHPLDPTAQRGIQRRGNHAFLAMLGEQGHASAGIRLTRGQGGFRLRWRDHGADHFT